MWTILTPIITFILGGICGGILDRFGGHLFDKILGRIRLEISTNPRSGPKYHGYYAAAEVGEHREDNNIFVISCDLNNHSKKPFIVHDYSASIRTDASGEWIDLEKHSVQGQDIHPTEHIHYSLGFEQFCDNPILISKLIDTEKLKGEFVLNAIIVMKLPLSSLRLNNRCDASDIICRIKLSERRGSATTYDLTLKRLFYKKYHGKAEIGYFDSSYRETIQGSGVLVKE